MRVEPTWHFASYRRFAVSLWELYEPALVKYWRSESCVFLETLVFIVLSAKHSSCRKKKYVEISRKLMKNSGLFLNMAKSFFSGFSVLWFIFFVLAKL